MNEISQRPSPRTPTQAAEGVPRWRWTTAELLRLKELGAFTDEDRFELIGGEIVPRSPTGRRHELVKEEIEDALRARQTSGAKVLGETQFNLGDDTYAKPDVLVRPRAIKTPDVKGETVLLVVEVADTSLSYDLSTKAALYAKHGVRDYWVVNGRTLATTVHREPGAEGYRSVVEVPSDTQLVPLLAPELTVRLDELDVA